MIATASPIAAGEKQAFVLIDATAARDFIARRTAKRDKGTTVKQRETYSMSGAQFWVCGELSVVNCDV